MGEGRGEGSCLFWHAIRSERKAPHSDPSKKLVLQVIIVQQLAQNEFLPWPAHSQRGYEALLLERGEGRSEESSYLSPSPPATHPLSPGIPSPLYPFLPTPFFRSQSSTQP